jgi:hypothetical protein
MYNEYFQMRVVSSFWHLDGLGGSELTLKVMDS